ncbi:glycosyltransferase [Luteimonas sp. MC1828]|nr:glycosyltransferase [Luteimonas sp. MC1828]
MLTALAERGCEVHLVLTSAGGALEPDVDARVTIHHLRTIRTWLPVSTIPVLGTILLTAKWLAARCQETWRRRRFRSTGFDAAICGSAGLSPDFICNVVDARKRFVFIRSDPGMVADGRWGGNIRNFHRCIDAYLCVSDSVRRSMQIEYPEVGEKCVTSYNLLNVNEMLARADGYPNPFGASPDSLCVLTVCRLQEVSKGLLRMVEVHRRLLEAGVPHLWHVVGDGPDRALLEQAIRAQGVSTTFKLHGAIENPFPFYKHADICAVLSRYEGLCGVVNEARGLERPVIATRFAGIEEQIEDGVNGLIVEQDLGAICDGLSSLIRDAELRERLARGGYPRELLNDDAKVDALMDMVSAVRGWPATETR